MSSARPSASVRKQADSGAAASSSAGKRAKTDAPAAAAAAAAAVEPAAVIKSSKGTDSDGKKYKSVDDLWKEQFEGRTTPAALSSDVLTSKKQAWYQKGADYWLTQAASVDGVLGGFGHVSPVDVSGSRAFLQQLPGVRYHRAIDCGAGIGRISRALLCPLFKEVDLVEQSPVYVDKAREYCAAGSSARSMRHYYTEGLQTFSFAPLSPTDTSRGPYDVIWIQWVVGHVPDADFPGLVRRCVRGLTPATGLIILKENNAKKGWVLDTEDQSVTRTDAQFRALFEKAGLELIATELQKNFPAVLFPVRMYALRPIPGGVAFSSEATAAAADADAAAAAAAAAAEPAAGTDVAASSTADASAAAASATEASMAE